MSDLEIIKDEAAYDQAAKRLVKSVVTVFAEQLNKSGKHNIDFEKPVDEDLQLLNDLCFLTFITFETSDAKQSEFAHVLFGPRRSLNGKLIASPKRSQLHGSVSDELIREALRDAR
ncbi:MAG: hypothetical protein AAGE03_09645 [Pseudomonadota bacterium]